MSRPMRQLGMEVVRHMIHEKVIEANVAWLRRVQKREMTRSLELPNCFDPFCTVSICIQCVAFHVQELERHEVGGCCSTSPRILR